MIQNTEKITVLMAANVSLGAFQQRALHWEPTFRALAPIGQIAVAVVTVIYFIREILRKKKDKSE